MLKKKKNVVLIKIILAMRRENDKYQMKEPFGRDIRKKMIESQKKALSGVERNLKLGQLKPTLLATVSHVANGLIQPERKPVVAQPKTEKKVVKKKETNKKKKDNKRKKSKAKSSTSDAENEAVEIKKPKKGDLNSQPKQKSISDITLKDFDSIRKHFPGLSKTDWIVGLLSVFLKNNVFSLGKS